MIKIHPKNALGIVVNNNVSEEGYLIKTYTRDGKQLSLYENDSGKGQQAAKFQSIIKDLEIVKYNLNYIMTEENTVISTENYLINPDTNSHVIANFFTSSVIMYCRCFAMSQGKGRGTGRGRGIKLDENEHIKKNLPQHLLIHRFIKQLRDEYFAHAGEDVIDSYIALFLFDGSNTLPIVHASYHLEIETDCIIEFLQLTNDLIHQLRTKVEALLKDELERVKGKRIPIERMVKFINCKKMNWTIWKENQS
ncbi:hypothetical protein G3485_03440 [Shewanella baltica]|uniref:hypothetical protein n=1 Tax=Shewanella baltica TaxID=62322 RepID=UPI00217F202C|nr:hypothetical protein [Shewanella baltica]MCS6125746.1 hypothetical protein [Shewanella baltica]MCS6138140.1 hypothetical protein [Shewanella baltica]MCS6144009.1 hypothetical protein [Shewanella baltica]MCS6168536.1 hypothetical protein [Shewanella baltica]MCS6185738.1 hypothetical protein [Shewanella baltica]